MQFGKRLTRLENLQRIQPTEERAERITNIQAKQAKHLAYLQRNDPQKFRQTVQRMSNRAERRSSGANRIEGENRIGRQN